MNLNSFQMHCVNVLGMNGRIMPFTCSYFVICLRFFYLFSPFFPSRTWTTQCSFHGGRKPLKLKFMILLLSYTHRQCAFFLQPRNNVLYDNIGGEKTHRIEHKQGWTGEHNQSNRK